MGGAGRLGNAAATWGRSPLASGDEWSVRSTPPTHSVRCPGARTLDSNRDSNRAVTPPASGERSGLSHRGADVTDADGGLARIYGSEDQDRETGSHSGSHIAQPNSYDHGRPRSTDCGFGREGRPAGPVRTFGRDLLIRRFGPPRTRLRGPLVLTSVH